MSMDSTVPEPREITQTRELTLAEAKALTKAVTRQYMQELKRDLWFRSAKIVHCGALGVLVGAALILSRRFQCCAPEVFWWVVTAAILYFVGAAIYYARYLRGIALINKSANPAGMRHIIDAQGYTIERGGELKFIPWSRLIKTERKPGLFLVATSPAHFWSITPTAFTNQDAEGFCAELERRWNAARVPSA